MFFQKCRRACECMFFFEWSIVVAFIASLCGGQSFMGEFWDSGLRVRWVWNFRSWYPQPSNFHAFMHPPSSLILSSPTYTISPFIFQIVIHTTRSSTATCLPLLSFYKTAQQHSRTYLKHVKIHCEENLYVTVQPCSCSTDIIYIRWLSRYWPHLPRSYPNGSRTSNCPSFH